jgi:hypothetical protein
VLPAFASRVRANNGGIIKSIAQTSVCKAPNSLKGTTPESSEVIQTSATESESVRKVQMSQLHRRSAQSLPESHFNAARTSCGAAADPRRKEDPLSSQTPISAILLKVVAFAKYGVKKCKGGW